MKKACCAETESHGDDCIWRELYNENLGLKKERDALKEQVAELRQQIGGYGMGLQEENAALRAALEKLVKSEVVRTAQFITYSEAYLEAEELLKRSSQTPPTPKTAFNSDINAINCVD